MEKEITPTTCLLCLGTGKKENLPCYKCAGSGYHTDRCKKSTDGSHHFKIVKNKKFAELNGSGLWICLFCNQSTISS